jgi:orotidine-5'-phosphate decarboxylase
MMSHLHFADRLCQAVKEKQSVVCVGLDPRWEQIPPEVRARAIEEHGRTRRAAAEAFYLFNHAIIEAVAPHCVAVKPQIAFYEQWGPEGLTAYMDTLADARKHGLLTIGDAKRGDIGSTSAAYAAAHLGISVIDGETTSAFRADALTVNPYFGTDGIQPFVETAAKAGAGLFILVKTSNAGSKDIQDLHAGMDPVHMHVARLVAQWGAGQAGESGFSLAGAVVGATVGEDVIRDLRRAMPKCIFLMPGYGAQGVRGDSAAPGLLAGGMGALVTSSREVIFAWERDHERGPEKFAEAAGAAAKAMRDDLNQYIEWETAASRQP